VRRSRLRSVTVGAARGAVYLAAALMILLGLAITLLETSWAKNQIRALIVRQANQHLNATLHIGGLEGSLLRGVRLSDIRLSNASQTIVAIDEVSVSYSLRELWTNGTVIRLVRLTRPRVVIAREPDGRWNMAALVRRDAREERPGGPGRHIAVLSIEIIAGDVLVGEDVAFGPAHIPTHFESLDTTFSFERRLEKSTFVFRHCSWNGSAPDLDMNNLTGTIENGPDGWRFADFSVRTPRSSFVMNGAIVRGDEPTRLDLDVRAARFAFQEWGGIVHGLRNIAINAQFGVRLQGPVDRLATTLRFAGDGGSINGTLVLDSTVPGWHGKGDVNVGRLNLARWLNHPDRPSDITGRVVFDLDLDLGGHFPRGAYRFDGPHASFMDYAADNVRAQGVLTKAEVRISSATGLAYGASVAAIAGSTIGLDEPFPFHFVGTVGGIDLRRLPRAVPVPHVESRLTFDYDTTGRFSDAYITGRATFDRSVFLGATVESGTVGTIDTSGGGLRYSGVGDLDGLDVNRLGAGLEIAWMQDPRYAGEVSGHFRVDGSGTDGSSTSLDAGGHIAHAAMFAGMIADADVTLGIDRGTLKTSFDGRFDRVDPAIALDDDRFTASLSGTANVRTTVRDLLLRTPAVADYDVEGTVALGSSTLRGFHVDRTNVTGFVRDAIGHFTEVDLDGPVLTGTGSGTVPFTGTDSASFDYDITRVDLAQLRKQIGRDVSGTASTKGRMSGPSDALRFTGNASAEPLAASGVSVQSMTVQYDVTVPSGDLSRAAARFDGSLSTATMSGQTLDHANGIVTIADGRIGLDVKAEQRARHGGVLADVLLHTADRRVDLVNLTLVVGQTPWQLTREAGEIPSVHWSGTGVAVDPMTFVAGASRNQRISLAGDWRRDGTGTLHVDASHVFLETLGAVEGPGLYGGVLDLAAIVRGTAGRPLVSADVTIANGRVQRVSYQQIGGHVDYTGDKITLDLRLDQSPGVWLTARGAVPRSFFDASAADAPLEVSILSSPIDLGLLEGATNVVRNVAGTVKLDVTAIGTGRDPHFKGTIELGRASFLVAATGAKYSNGRATISLAADRIEVEALHLEDSNRHMLDAHGSLGTHELRVGDLEMGVTARRFEVLRNAFGKIDIDAAVELRGHAESPRIAGTVTVNGQLRVDNILERALFEPYSTEAAAAPGGVDPMAALNPWDRLGLDVSLSVPNTLRLVGDSVQIASGTPIGLGKINARVGGDLYLYKDPRGPLSITGSFDSVSGTIAFQGRQFDVDPSSSINFRGDLNPELYVTVNRTISAVETRVAITGPLKQPELVLSSIPPLEQSDILSLIVFNASPTELSAAQQQELAVRAGTLAAGFVTAPIVSALQHQIGLDVLQIDPSGDLGTAPKVTVGQEIVPGLVARFSRQFGSEPYDEATIEYYLSRFLRLRATFSDAQALESLSPFRRIERAGVDLLFFLSF
jgi:hypothetical protein